MALTPLPTAPDRTDPDTFAERSDAWVSAIPLFATELDALQLAAEASEIAAAASESAAALSAATATSAAASAVATSGAAKWVSGTTYALGAAVWSPIDAQTYRRIVAGAGATDPSADATNWTKLGVAGVLTNGTNTFTAAQTFDGGLILTNYVRETPAVANTGTAYTIDLASATLFNLTLTGNCTYTFPTATSGTQFTIVQLQDATGSRTVTWPSSVRWAGGTAPVITATASKTDVISFVADGTYWLGFVGGQNYTRA